MLGVKNLDLKRDDLFIKTNEKSPKLKTYKSLFHKDHSKCRKEKKKKKHSVMYRKPKFKINVPLRNLLKDSHSLFFDNLLGKFKFY